MYLGCCQSRTGINLFLASKETTKTHLEQLEEYSVLTTLYSFQLAHLDRKDSVISGDLFDRLTATDRLHGDSALELGTARAALTHWWEPDHGHTPPQRLMMGPD